MRKRAFRTLLLFVLHFGVTSLAHAQQDSVVHFFRQIRSSNDSIGIRTAVMYMHRSGPEVLASDSLFKQLEETKKVLDEKDYCEIVFAYYYRLTRENTPSTNEAAIRFGQRLVDANIDQGSSYCHLAYIVIFRDIRLPYRNLGRIQDMIRYFGSKEQFFMERKDSFALSVVYNVMSNGYFRLGLSDRSTYYQLKSASLLRDIDPDYSHPSAGLFDKSGKVNRYAVLGSMYLEEKNLQEAEKYLAEAVRIFYTVKEPEKLNDAPFVFLTVARIRTLQGDPESGKYYDTAYSVIMRYNPDPLEITYYTQERAIDFMSKMQLDSAKLYADRAIRNTDSLKLPFTSYFGELRPRFVRAKISLLEGKPKEAVNYLLTEIADTKNSNIRVAYIEYLRVLADAYSKSGDNAKAYATLQEAFELKEKVASETAEARTISFDTEKKMQEDETRIMVLNARNESNRKITYYLVGIAVLLGLFAILLAVFYSNKRKSNQSLAAKNKILADTLEQLKATQSSLVQSEKMASLGELTAGIAHEIQNPLNFVNNFSEVNIELLEELKTQHANDGAYDLLNDIMQNNEKIIHHGKRADAIVKGMLQHSQAGTGEKTPTDLNALVDEYTRLCYLGIRAKDNSFTATIQANFDPAVGKVDIIPQDIAKVIVNICNNAFYAMKEKKNSGIHDVGYEPTLLVATKRSGNKVTLQITDNGNGIPQNIIDKIFQPFFTTKPTGQGTGLGLSLSYDIVTKGHRGELKVETSSEGSTFVIVLT